jgi:hypothetical protein
LPARRRSGVYPLLPDDTCHFLAVDFDKAEWREDAKAFVQSCRELDVPVALEISRGAAIIAHRRVNTLILVHRTELLRQWQERLNAFLGIGKGVVGTIGDGKRKPTGKIDIAVMQSLSRKGEVDPLVEDYGQVIVDGSLRIYMPLLRQRRKYMVRASISGLLRYWIRPLTFEAGGSLTKAYGRRHKLGLCNRKGNLS